MSATYPIAFVNQYRDNVIILSQQKGSRLRSCIREEELTGKYHLFDRLGSVEAYKKTSRHQSTVYDSTPHTRRGVRPDDWTWADLVDQEDKVKALIDPTSPYAINGAYAMGRAVDIAILKGAYGAAESLDADDAKSSVAFPTSTNQIAEAFATTTTLTLAKLIEAKRILDAADVDPDEERYMIVNAKNLSDLLNIDKLTSSDYATVKSLVAGEINTFMGFTFKRTELLSLAKSGLSRSGKNDCIAWAKSGVGLAMNRDLVTKIDQLPEKMYSTQVFLAQSFGATRIEDEKVVWILNA